MKNITVSRKALLASISVLRAQADNLYVQVTTQADTIVHYQRLSAENCCTIQKLRDTLAEVTETGRQSLARANKLEQLWRSDIEILTRLRQTNIELERQIHEAEERAETAECKLRIVADTLTL
jgi:hypothetical protein